ncbi:MAG TPA: type II toxin-antitoxin system prevent-host-death family antitoxin [Planctomycetota bacterium]|nr:type II toxin-antitoxin system prevent-host-death family antitoxin [Planctomycetota bacterium]
MVKAGLREFKNRFGYYVRKVREGETVEVTDRGRSFARFVPSAGAELRKKLEPLIKSGQVSWGGGKFVGLNPRVRVTGKPLSEMIVEDRGDPVP